MSDSPVTAADRVWAAVRKITEGNQYHPTHLGGCIGGLSDIRCECGITDLHFAVRAYDRGLSSCPTFCGPEPTNPATKEALANMVRAVTDPRTPDSNAKTLGAMVTVALIESAAALDALRRVGEALDAGDIHQAKVIVHNFLTVTGDHCVLTDLEKALYQATPRESSDVSYG